MILNPSRMTCRWMRSLTTTARSGRCSRVCGVIGLRCFANGLAREPCLRRQPLAECLDLRPRRTARTGDEPVSHGRVQPHTRKYFDQLTGGEAVCHHRQPRQCHALPGQRGLGDLVGIVEVEPALGFELLETLRIEPAAPG